MTEEDTTFVPSDKIHGGFLDFAHLRLRDHRPGIGEYELPPEFGPKSASLKKSILGKNYRIDVEPATRVGPGEYAIPTTIGTGRSTRFGPELSADDGGTSGSPGGATADKGNRDRSAEAVAPREPAKQYSMALTPDTPAYSIYGKLTSQFDNPYTCSAGPGEYVIPSAFDRPTRGVQPGAHFGLRLQSSESKEQEKIPGPGAYDLKRFGDVLPTPRDPLVGLRRRKRVDPLPGPGAYEDPTTIAARLGKRRLKLAQSSTFGGRHDAKRYHTAGPGPAYNTVGVHRLLEPNQRHAPTFARPTAPRSTSPATGTRSRSADSGKTAVPIDVVLPSDFDYHYLKGKSMLGRWKDRARETERAGPGSYEVSGPASRAIGPHFGPGTFDPYAALRAREASKQREAAEEAGGGGGARSYHPNYASVEPHAPAAAFFTSDPRPPAGNGVPGPGHYSPDYAAALAEGTAHVFYKGDFHDRSTAPKTASAGPGAHYRDDTRYSRSINGDRVSKKGVTFGIRYPARATHQVCKPYDERTNINVLYDDERTWEVEVKLPKVNHTM